MNEFLPEGERIQGGLGSGFFIKGSQTRHSPRHSGIPGDTDSQGGKWAMRMMADYAEAHGLRVVRDGNVIEIPTLNHAVNKHASTRNAGSAAHRAEIAVDARTEERFLAPGIEKGHGLDATHAEVMNHDHMKKAADGNKLGAKNAKLLFKKKNQPKLQKLAKSTHKMMGNVPDEAIARYMAKNGLDGTPADFRKSVEDLYRRNYHSAGVGSKTAKEWFATIRDVQEDSIRRAAKMGARERQARRKYIERLKAQANDPNLKEPERTRARLSYEKAQERFTDAEVRRQQAMTVTDESLGRKPKTAVPKPPLPAPEPLELKRRGLAKAVKDGGKLAAGGAVMVGSGALKLAGGLSILSNLQQAYDAVQAKDWAKVAAIVGEEAFDQMLDRTVPVAGQFKTAFDIGYLAGRGLGAYLKVGPNGESLDRMAEKGFRALFDSLSGNARVIAAGDQREAEVNYFTGVIASIGLPAGMTAKQVLARARGQARRGFSFQLSVLNILEAAHKQQRAEISKASGGDKSKVVWRSKYCSGIARDFVHYRYPVIDGVPHHDHRSVKNSCSRIGNLLRLQDWRAARARAERAKRNRSPTRATPARGSTARPTRTRPPNRAKSPKRPPECVEGRSRYQMCAGLARRYRHFRFVCEGGKWKKIDRELNNCNAIHRRLEKEKARRRRR